MTKPVAAAILLSLGMTMAGCSSASYEKRGLDSLHQPVVKRTNYTIDLVTGAGGLSLPEQRRLAGWFEAMDLRYGDRVALDDPLESPVTRNVVSQIAGRYGILLAEGTPVTPGYVDPGNARVVITRSTASVPNCPDWSDTFASNLGNETRSNFGCAVNSNLAAMVADPEHLIRGARGSGETVVMSSNKAIDSYRTQAPTGMKGLTTNATGGN
ncbi:CpaD family pilus assembly protein [Croceicoccus estronivorus]|uniref:CpaD family pilus assembly protein n=1 Tax=Croceicoccus estronivorus TaxID=1172626 RepID=UPI001F25BD72|nr:CpaD family pilus assembly protein [Croceicoccus estronivorus]